MFIMHTFIKNIYPLEKCNIICTMVLYKSPCAPVLEIL